MSQFRCRKSVVRAGNKSLKDGYKAAKGQTEHMRGGYQPVKGAEISIIRARNKSIRSGYKAKGQTEHKGRLRPG